MQIPPVVLPVIQVTLPVMAAIFYVTWSNIKRIDALRAETRRMRGDLRAGFPENRSMTSRACMNTGLERIESVLREHSERITSLEERIQPPVHR